MKKGKGGAIHRAWARVKALYQAPGKKVCDGLIATLTLWLKLAHKVKPFMTTIIIFIGLLFALSFYYDGFGKYRDMVIAGLISAATGWVMVNKVLVNKNKTRKICYNKFFQASLDEIDKFVVMENFVLFRHELKRSFKTLKHLAALSNNETLINECNVIIEDAKQVLDSTDKNVIMAAMEKYDSDASRVTEQIVK